MTGILCSIAGATYAAAVRTAKTVTAVGNTQVSTAQSNFGGASALFDGNGDRLTVTSAGDFGFSGDFTLEGWFRFSTLSSQFFLFDFRLSTDGSVVKPTLYWTNSGGANNLRYFVNGADRITGTTNALSTNTWYHIALCKSGTSTKLFLDGTQQGSTYTDTNTYVDSNCAIGDYAGTGYGLNGYIDEVRFSNSARYTTTFTPSTAAFTNDVNTLLLLHCNGSNTTTVFTDDIGTNFIPRTPKTITVGGNAKVSTAQSKFGGASALFDGTSDYLSVPAISSDLKFGTGDFTLEAFVQQRIRSDAMTIFDTRNSGDTSGGFILYMRADNYMELYWNSANVSSANPLPTASTWYHVAISRSGSSLKVFVDGTSVISITDSTNHTAAGPFIVGQDFQLTATPGNSWDGYIDEIRFSNTARYTANFTAPTAAFTNDRNTVLLIHTDGTNAQTTFTDDNGVRSPKGISAIGNAKVSTAQSKFGGASALFDGTNDGLSVDNSDFAFGTSDFTYECFVRVADTNAFMLFDGTNPTGSNNAVSVWAQSGVLNVYSGGWTLQGVGTINNNTWYHVAVSRSAGNLKAFIDGTQVGTTQSFSIDFTQSILHMGKARIDAGYDGNGYMDEIRVSSTARYTANFTAPTAAFTNDTNTLLLIHADGTNNATTFTDDNA